MGLFLFALISWLTRKRVIVFLYRQLVCQFILCQLISDILCNRFFVPSYCIYIVSLHQNCRFPYLYFKLACLSNIISELFPLRYPINCDTLYFGGILTSKRMWPGHASAPIISTPLYSHNFLIILPTSAFICPYIICLRYFGTKTM